MALPNRIKERREAFGISQAKLSERSGVSLRAIQTYEQGLREPLASNLYKIANALKCKMEDLI